MNAGVEETAKEEVVGGIAEADRGRRKKNIYIIEFRGFVLKGNFEGES